MSCWHQLASVVCVGQGSEPLHLSAQVSGKLKCASSSSFQFASASLSKTLNNKAAIWSAECAASAPDGNFKAAGFIQNSHRVKKSQWGRGGSWSWNWKGWVLPPLQPPPSPPTLLHRLPTPARENNLALRAVITVKGCTVTVACVRKILWLFHHPEVLSCPI